MRREEEGHARVSSPPNGNGGLEGVPGRGRPESSGKGSSSQRSLVGPKVTQQGLSEWDRQLEARHWEVSWGRCPRQGVTGGQSLHWQREWRGSPQGRKNQNLDIFADEDIRLVQMTLVP